MTDQRLLIVPNWLDGMTGARRIELQRNQISEVRIEPPGTALARRRGLSARIRPQVEVSAGDQMWAMTLAAPDRLLEALNLVP